jgi:hypothetical protein
MDGNPMARSRPQQYRSFSLAFLPQLKYLDYALVLAADVSTAAPAPATPRTHGAVLRTWLQANLPRWAVMRPQLRCGLRARRMAARGTRHGGNSYLPACLPVCVLA